jgi:hypothetical protein
VALVQLLLGLLADAVFASATRDQKSFEAEISRHLPEHRGEKALPKGSTAR